MAVKANLLSIPAELREQILHHYFRVDGGYAYDGDSDCLKTAVGNRPIDLALLYTCRTVANEARHLPLSLNTIKFTTLYRRDLNNLAGCFNFVSGLYHHIEADLVVLLAKFLTPEMRAELALEYPGFGPPLAMAVDDRDNDIDLRAQREGDVVYSTGIDRNNVFSRISSEQRTYRGNSAAGAAKMSMQNQLADAFCRWAECFIYLNEDASSKDYPCFSNLKRNPASSYRGFPGSFWRAENFWSHALELLAQGKPSEFSRQIYTTFPHWIDRYSAQAFLDMRFEHWVIPSQAHVERAIELLALEGMWNLPDMWHDARHPEPWNAAPQSDTSASASTPRVRCREKIRFSAVANAIRFLETRIYPQQRLDIRTVLLYEDFPSVNVPSAHAQGLAPFFRENPLLRVERRVDLMRCINGAFNKPSTVAAHFQQLDNLPEEPEIHSTHFRSALSQWLLDALAVTSVGIPDSSFTLTIEAGPYRDWITDLFLQRFHKEIAWRRAFEHLQRMNPFGERNFMHGAIEDAMIQPDEIEAFETLMNKTSHILRTDFSTGVGSWDVDTIVNDTQYLSLDMWFRHWAETLHLLTIEQPTHQVDYKARLADNYEVQAD
ncbi:hypothetical protein NW768_002556 [Fusarium equiseti]|uniref:Uncharacterized protein n=1 Tax=Fusarium equiseti TaxID=61235 RepID=A0ABQ8RNS3_FUSEQ|nr:hypothetical protein NW768_002556 [Fusarium equiseti]